MRETQATASTGADARPGAIPFGSGGAFRSLMASLSAKDTGFASLRGALARSPDRASGTSHAASGHHHAGKSAGGTAVASASGQAALAEAMRREGVPATWQAALQYIMGKESGGGWTSRTRLIRRAGYFS